MTADKVLPFAGTDEELEKYLQEFARLAGGWVGKNQADGTWTLTAGARGSSNRASRVRSVVIVMFSDNSERSAIRFSTSISRTI